MADTPAASAADSASVSSSISMQPPFAVPIVAAADLDGSPNVSKPQNVKRLLHVEWDAATGAFKARDVHALETNYMVFSFAPTQCAVATRAKFSPKLFPCSRASRAVSQGLPDVWASALPPAVATRDVVPSSAFAAAHVAPPKPSRKLVRVLLSALHHD
jgi:hypothetical protein